MSIIEEALRRIQDPTLAKTQGTAADPKKSAPAAKADKAPAPPAHSWTAGSAPAGDGSGLSPVTIVGLSVLALGVLVVAGALIWFSRAMAPQPMQMASRPSARAQEEFEFAAPPPPAPALPDPVTLTNQSLTELDQPAARPGGSTFTMPWVKIQPAKSKDFVLSGVVEGGEPYAVINDLIVGVGEQVDGATLVGIDRGAVTLRKSNGQDVVLRIEQ